MNLGNEASQALNKIHSTSNSVDNFIAHNWNCLKPLTFYACGILFISLFVDSKSSVPHLCGDNEVLVCVNIEVEFVPKFGGSKESFK